MIFGCIVEIDILNNSFLYVERMHSLSFWDIREKLALKTIEIGGRQLFDKSNKESLQRNVILYDFDKYWLISVYINLF